MAVVRVQKARVFRHTPTAKIWAWTVKVLPFLLVLLIIFAMCFVAITRVSLRFGRPSMYTAAGRLITKIPRRDVFQRFGK